MSRQIKNDIFNSQNQKNTEDSLVERFLKENQKSTSIEKNLRSSSTSLEFDYTDFQILSAKIDQMRKDVLDATNNVKSLDSALSSTIDTSDNRFERIKSALMTMDKQYKNSLHDVYQKLAELNSKVIHRKMNEDKIEQMLNRHNSVIQGFEHKVNTMQKLIAEQEMQLAHSRASLKDAIRYIEKLKRV
ncbi:MAG: hypothetical protein KDD50_10695 [Bdellovibrionales bacterium]|nr:hypothetical protein [Bdellovibrionales bacterium]